MELHMNIVDSNDSGNAGAALGQLTIITRSTLDRKRKYHISLPDSNDEKENDTQFLFYWDLDTPQELNGP